MKKIKITPNTNLYFLKSLKKIKKLTLFKLLLIIKIYKNQIKQLHPQNVNQIVYKVDDNYECDDAFDLSLLTYNLSNQIKIIPNISKIDLKSIFTIDEKYYTFQTTPPIYLGNIVVKNPNIINILGLKLNWFLIFFLNSAIINLNIKNYNNFINKHKNLKILLKNDTSSFYSVNNLNDDELSRNIFLKWVNKKPKTFKLIKFFNDHEDMARWYRYNSYRVKKQKINKFNLLKITSTFNNITQLFKTNLVLQKLISKNIVIFEFFLMYSMNTNLMVLSFWRKLKRFYNVKKTMFFGFKRFFKKNKKNKIYFINKTPQNYFNTTWIKKIPLELKNHIIHRWKIKKQFNYLKYFSIFWLGFFENFSSLKTLVYIHKNTIFSQQIKSCIKYFYKKYFTLQVYIGKGFFLSEMLYIILITFTNKDIILLKNWVKINFERMDFMKHRKFLYFIKLIIKELWVYLTSTLKIKGFYFDVRGKLSVSGNAKKRHYLIKLGKYSLSTKNHRIEYTRHLIRTKTGVLGVTFYLIH